MPQTSGSAAQPPFVDLEPNWIPGTSSHGFLGTGWRWKLISFPGLPEGFCPLATLFQVILSFPVPHIPQIPWGPGKLRFSLQFPQSLFRAGQSPAN